MTTAKKNEEPVLIPPEDPPDVPKGEQWTVSPEELSTNFRYVVGAHEQFDCQFTVRGNPTVEEIEAHFKSVLAAMTHIVTKGAHARAQSVGAPVKPQPADAPLPQEPRLEAVPGAVNTMRVIKVTVEPPADDPTKTRVGLWEKEKGEGHQWPDLNISGPIERVIKALGGTAGWTPELMRVPQSYAVAWDVDWVESEKKSSSGRPYKNVVAIRKVE